MKDSDESASRDSSEKGNLFDVIFWFVSMKWLSQRVPWMEVFVRRLISGRLVVKILSFGQFGNRE
jgi:hypothetical protein